ncbi:MAG: hypothetical protein LH624_06345 [Cryobacterium sp.]|nr:hypothetical protein [Cryobacterium sp.]
MPRRSHLRRLAWACVLATGLTGIGGCGSQSSVSGPPGARLVVLPELTRDGMFSLVSGTLGINDQGCFTLDDRVLVVGKGSRVLTGEESIDVADVGVVEVGSRTSGGGGLIDGIEEVEYFAKAVGLGDEAMACQSDGEEPALTVLDPSGP